MVTDFPVPVAPAISRCGILARSATTGFPSRSRPSAIGSAARTRHPVGWLDELPERHDPRDRVGDLHPDGALPRNRRDPYRRHPHGDREIVRQGHDPSRLHSGRRDHLELGHDRSGGSSAGPPVHLEGAQCLDQRLPQSVELCLTSVLNRGFRRHRQQGDRGEPGPLVLGGGRYRLLCLLFLFLPRPDGGRHDGRVLLGLLCGSGAAPPPRLVRSQLLGLLSFASAGGPGRPLRFAPTAVAGATRRSPASGPRAPEIRGAPPRPSRPWRK